MHVAPPVHSSSQWHSCTVTPASLAPQEEAHAACVYCSETAQQTWPAGQSALSSHEGLPPKLHGLPSIWHDVPPKALSQHAWVDTVQVALPQATTPGLEGSPEAGSVQLTCSGTSASWETSTSTPASVEGGAESVGAVEESARLRASGAAASESKGLEASESTPEAQAARPRAARSAGSRAGNIA